MKFRGQGRPLLADRDSDGSPLAFRPMGCADSLGLKFNIDTFEHIETCTGQGGVDARGTKRKSGEVTLDLTEWSISNLELALNGEYTAAPGSPSTVSAEVLPDDLLVGDSVLLGGDAPATNVSSLVITDSTGSPVTLISGTDYTADLVTGRVTFLAVPGTQPYKAAYSHTNQPFVSFLTQGQTEKWLRFDYINTQNNNQRGIVDLYRVLFDPTDQFDLVNDELQHLNLTGAMLVDDTKPLGGPLGQFGRVSVPTSLT